MRRTYFLIVVVFGMAAATFAQTTSSDSQSLEALLTEVRQLRKDLQISLTRMEAPKFCYRGCKFRKWPFRVRHNTWMTLAPSSQKFKSS
jgi:hypothetical protein